jgi:hypothetical protein
MTLRLVSRMTTFLPQPFCLHFAQGTLATARSLFGSPAAAAAFAGGAASAGSGWQLSEVTVDSAGKPLLIGIYAWGRCGQSSPRFRF